MIFTFIIFLYFTFKFRLQSSSSVQSSEWGCRPWGAVAWSLPVSTTNPLAVRPLVSYLTSQCLSSPSVTWEYHHSPLQGIKGAHTRNALKGSSAARASVHQPISQLPLELCIAMGLRPHQWNVDRVISTTSRPGWPKSLCSRPVSLLPVGWDVDGLGNSGCCILNTDECWSSWYPGWQTKTELFPLLTTTLPQNAIYMSMKQLFQVIILRI